MKKKKSTAEGGIQSSTYLLLSYRQKILQTLLISSLIILGLVSIVNANAYLTNPEGLWNARNLITDGMAFIILLIACWLNARGIGSLASMIFILFLYAAIPESYSIEYTNQAFLVAVLPVSLSSFILAPWTSLPLALISIGLYSLIYANSAHLFRYDIFSVGLLISMAIGSYVVSHVLSRAIRNMALAYDETIEGWAKALEMRDTETSGHSQRVVTLTLELARKMGIKDADLIHLRRGVLIHDIGKMAIPDAILQKPGELTPAEWAIMRQHPEFARQYLADVHYLAPALDIPFCHHEKWDGSGYPQGLRGEQIPLFARIFAIVDVWDALTSDRPYREKWTHQKTLQYLLAESGKHFDPEIVPIFIALIQEQSSQPPLRSD